MTRWTLKMPFLAGCGGVSGGEEGIAVCTADAWCLVKLDCGLTSSLQNNSTGSPFAIRQIRVT